MEWQRDLEAAPGKCAAASAARGSRPLALARLEPQSTPTGLHAARSAPTHRDEPVAARHFAIHPRRDPLPVAADACSPLVGRAVGSQRASFNSWVRHDQAFRHPSTFCCLARVGDGVTPHLPTTSFLLLGQLRHSEWLLMAFFPGFSSSTGQRPVLNRFRFSDRHELFNKLVAQFL